MKLVFRYLKKYWYMALLASAFMVGEVYVDLLQPRMMAQIVDEGILGKSTGGQPNVQLVISTGLQMMFIVFAGGLSGILSGLFANITGQRSANEIRKECFERIMHFSFEQTDDFSTGSLITRITNDVSQVQQLIMQLIRSFVRSSMLFIGGTIALLSLDLRFGVVAACAFPFIILDIVFIIWRTNPLFFRLQESLDKLNSLIQEDVNGIRVVKAFRQEKTEEDRFGAANQNLVDTQFHVQILMSFLRPVMNIVLNFAIAAIIYVSISPVKEGSLEPGTVMAAVTYISLILNGMRMMAMIFQTISRGVASSKRLQEILNTQSDIKQEPLAMTGDGSRGSVRFAYYFIYCILNNSFIF